MSLRQELHKELEAIHVAMLNATDASWWAVLEDTVTRFATRRKLDWMKPNEEVHKWLRARKNV